MNATSFDKITVDGGVESRMSQIRCNQPVSEVLQRVPVIPFELRNKHQLESGTGSGGGRSGCPCPQARGYPDGSTPA